MAQYTVTHTCGHAETVNLVGPHVQRERTLDRYESHRCLNCTRSAELEQAATADLPSLTGTDKQVPWATTIRAKGLSAIAAWLDDFEAQCVAHNSPAAEVERARALYHGLRDTVIGQTAAKWWIDHRFDDARGLLKAVK